jgi:hypothetical protein
MMLYVPHPVSLQRRRAVAFGTPIINLECLSTKMKGNHVEPRRRYELARIFQNHHARAVFELGIWAAKRKIMPEWARPIREHTREVALGNGNHGSSTARVDAARHRKRA